MHIKIAVQELGFGENYEQFYEWLRSPTVQSHWVELFKDYLTKDKDTPRSHQVNVNKIMERCNEEIKNPLSKYREQNPDKSNWDKYDHHYRFTIMMIISNRAPGCIWERYDDVGIPFLVTRVNKVYRVLQYQYYPRRTGPLHTLIHEALGAKSESARTLTSLGKDSEDL